MSRARCLLAVSLVLAASHTRPLALSADPPKDAPKEVRALEGTFTGAWTMYGIDDKGAVVKKMTWTDTMKATGTEVKDGRAFVTTVNEMTFEGAKGPVKIEGKEGYYLNKDGALGDYFIETFGRATRVTKLADTVWTYADAATEQELTRLGFPKGSTGQHVVVKVVTKEQGTEMHLITRVTTVNWKSADGKAQILQFSSLQGHHTRKP
jgi:hypothetical protein